MHVIVFPIVQARIFGWPDSVTVSDKNAKRLRVLSEGAFLAIEAFNDLAKIGLVDQDSGKITEMGKSVLQVIKEGEL